MVFRMRISPEEVEKEKPIIGDEERDRRNLDRRMGCLINEYIFGKDVDPIGDKEVIQCCHAKHLKEFYE